MTAPANRTALIASLANWLRRSDLSTTEIPEAIALAEQRFNRELRVPEMEEVVAATTAAATITLPADFLMLRSAFLDTDPKVPLEQMTPADLRSFYASAATGRPKAPGPGRRGGGFGDFLLGFFGGPQVAQAIGQRRQARGAAALAAEEEGRRMEAAGNLGLSKDQINAMTPADLSALVRARAMPAAPAYGGFGAGGLKDDDATPAVENGWLYEPGEGGRLDKRNWRRIGQ